MGDDSIVGKVLSDRYEVMAELGRGQLGIVYKARHILMDRLVAVKVMAENIRNNSEAFLRFQREAKAASSLNHPNIVTVFDFGRLPDGYPFLVMDYLEGPSLADLLEREGIMKPERASNIFYQMCAALAHAHKRGVLHRDLKPSNIVVVPSDEGEEMIKVVDFGLARRFDESNQTVDKLTLEGQVCGTPLYMSPEQCSGKKLDSRSDVYALGCVMFEILTGRPPLRGQNVLETISLHLIADPVSFEEACPDAVVPENLQAVIYKALSKAPEDRQESMLALKAELRGAFEDTKAQATLVARDFLRPRVEPEDRDFEYYAAAAERGEASAQYQLARCFELGSGVEPDIEDALYWYRRAAENGNTDAQTSLGWLYDEGEKVEQNYAEAAKWFAMAANNGDPSAQFMYACYLEFGDGVEADPKESLAWFSRAAAQGHKLSEYNVGRFYFRGIGVATDYAKAIEIFLPLAESGDSWAQYFLGEAFKEGSGVEQDWEAAVDWYTKAGNGGVTPACNELGECYQMGLGVPVDHALSAHWYRQAAQSGDPHAQFKLGNFLLSGSGGERNLAEAFHWCEESVEQGGEDALISLGNCYRFGQGVSPDLEQAIDYYRRAANEHNNSEAMRALAECCRSRSSGRNTQESIYWYRCAANLGDPEAQFQLGVALLNGEGVAKALEESMSWLEKAKDSGIEGADIPLARCYKEAISACTSAKKKANLVEKATRLGDSQLLRELGLFPGQDPPGAIKAPLVQKTSNPAPAEAAFAIFESQDPESSGGSIRLAALRIRLDRAAAGAFEQSQRLIFEAAKVGDLQSQAMVGLMLLTGEGVEANVVEAVKWLRTAAEGGNAAAQWNLALCFANGEGVNKDYAESLAWFGAAAGHRFAKDLPWLPEGFQKRLENLIEVFNRLSSLGLKEAQFWLGICREDGLGIGQDLEEAVRLYGLSAAQGHEPATRRLEELGRSD